MYCPRCAHKNTKVCGTTKGLVNIRYRRCPKCGYAFTTKEIPRADLLAVEYIKYLEETKEINEKESKEVLQKDEFC